MSHYYTVNQDGSIRLLDDVSTPAQARQARLTGRSVFASVTTKLSLLPSGLQDWREGKIVELARMYPDKSVKEIQDLCWGLRTTPDGRTLPSSEFGTEVHSILEEACLAYRDGSDYHNDTWLCYYRPFMQWIETSGIEVLECEYRVACSLHNTAGTIDGVGRDANGRVILWDFKTREVGNGDIKRKYYDKDVAQLAVQAEIIAAQWELDHIPRIYTIIIGSDTAAMYPKLWTEKAQSKGYEKFNIVSRFFDELEG